MRNFLACIILGLTTSSFGQNKNYLIEDCKTIEFVQKDSANSTSKILPFYQKQGFFLMPNGVYDFVIDGHKYFQSIYLGVSNNILLISYNWETLGEKELIRDTLAFDLSHRIEIRMVAINNGVGGLIKRTDFNEYSISVIDLNRDSCRFQNAIIMTKDKTFLGHYYFTQYGFKKIKIVNGKPYLCEDSGEYVLRRK